MSEAVIVENQPWLKAVLVIGLAAFLLGGIGSLFYAVTGAETMSAQLVMSGCGAFFLCMVVLGARLLPYLHHCLEFSDTGLRIIGGGKTSPMTWSSLRFRLHDTLQIVELLDSTDRRIYAVDYWARNASLLLQRIYALEEEHD
jgi:hypothetical protein